VLAETPRNADPGGLLSRDAVATRPTVGVPGKWSSPSENALPQAARCGNVHIAGAYSAALLSNWIRTLPVRRFGLKTPESLGKNRGSGASHDWPEGRIRLPEPCGVPSRV
jgi:hypothetical protein